ncbi:MAG: hypothetical protein HYT70_00940 [Candidatus Aenigmarchaeota archaeon]|nr:hypothetical protein [Candidatus Aenigmarchaeota archaeon]
MDKSEILKHFLNKGIQVNSEALDTLYNHPERLEEITSMSLKELPLVLSEDFILKGRSVKILKQLELKKRYSVEDATELINYRYSFIKTLLAKKNLENLISANRISDKLPKFTLIALVTQVGEREIKIEDNTGSLTLEASPEILEHLLENDIVALVCEKEEGFIKVTEVIFPDIEIKRAVVKSEQPSHITILPTKLDIKNYGKLLELVRKQPSTKIFLLETDIDIGRLKADLSEHEIFFFGGEANNKEEMLYPNPALIEFNNVKIFLTSSNLLSHYAEKWDIDMEKTMTLLLKRRNLNPSSSLHEGNIYFLDIVPDIIIMTKGDPAVYNYKGTTVLLGGDSAVPILWHVDLQTREIFKTSFL